MSIGVRTEPEVKRFGASALMHIDSLYRLALYVTGDKNDAQELVSDTYLRAYGSFNESDEKASSKVWLLGILNDIFMNAIRHGRKHLRILPQSETEEQEVEGPRDAHNEADSLEVPFDYDLIAVMNELPVRYKIVVLLADVEELSYKEIADIVGCSEKVVMYRLCKGRRMFGKGLRSRNL